MKKRLQKLLSFSVAAALLSAPASALEIYASAVPQEKILERRIADGAAIRVHYTEEALAKAGEDVSFARRVLDDSESAYRTITEKEGFSTAGFSFVSPDRNYAYDADGVIDVFIGDAKGDDSFHAYGIDRSAFKDAPCFDTLKTGDKAFQAVLLIPANYRGFIQDWEKLNPSPLGPRGVSSDLKGTLTHEMLHAVLFYYNRNLNAERKKGIHRHDWYVEGLARYFETLAGAKHDFYSQGFRQVLPDRIRFSRGGSNFYMRYPDQAFSRLRYENAIFWRHLDHAYGMPAIEAVSRAMRDSKGDTKMDLERGLGVPLDTLLQDFSRAILSKDFGLKEEAIHLSDVARTHLVYRSGRLYLNESGRHRYVGRTCRTDWVSEWGGLKAAYKTQPIAGDSTPKADVSPWATDFFQIDVESGDAPLPVLRVNHTEGRGSLLVQVLITSRGGAESLKRMEPVPSGQGRSMMIGQIVAGMNLKPADIQKIDLLVTNSDPEVPSEYEIAVFP